MFDLFRSRAKAVRYLLGGLLTLVALSMVITLIPGWNSSTASADDLVVAQIGKNTITVQQIQAKLQDLIRQKQIPAEMAQVYLPQIIDDTITSEAIAYQAQRMGFEVPDAELAAAIRQAIPRVFNNGQLIDKAAYEQTLAQMGMTIPMFEELMRQQMLKKRLDDLAAEGVVVTPQEVMAEYKRRNDKVKIAYIDFKPDALKDQVKVTPEELQAYYNNNKEGFRVPEKRNVALLVADRDKMAASIQIPEAQLRQAYDQHKDQFRTPERVKVRHILLMTEGKPAADVPKIKAQAEDILKQVKANNGATFDELAKKYSEDPGSKDKGGDLGWVVRGQTVPEFEKTAFSLKPKEISGIVTTQYGFHILQVLDKQEAHLQTFDEVKDQLASEMKKQLINDRMESAVEQARAALVKAPGQFAQIATQYGLELVQANGITQGMPYPSIGASAELDAALAGMKKGDVTPVFQPKPTELAFAELTDVIPSQIAPFADVEKGVRDRFTSMRALVLAGDKAKQAADRVKAGEDMAAVAKALGGEYKTPPDFNMEGAIEGLGSAAMFQDAFAKPVGTVLGPLNVFNQQIVAKITDKKEDPTGFATQRDVIVFSLKQKKVQDHQALFYDSILTQLIKDGKVKKHNDTIRRLIASYRNS